MLGACVVRLWSHVVAPVFRELLCLGGCVLRSSCASALLEFLLLWLIHGWRRDLRGSLAGVREARSLQWYQSSEVVSFPARSECELQESIAAVAGCACFERGCWFARAAVGFVLGLRIRVVERQLDLSSVAARLRGSFPTEPVTREAHPYLLPDACVPCCTLVERCDTCLWLLSALRWLVANPGEVLPEFFFVWFWWKLVSAGCCATSGLRYAVVVLAVAFWWVFSKRCLGGSGGVLVKFSQDGSWRFWVEVLPKAALCCLPVHSRVLGCAGGTSCVPLVERFAMFLVPYVLCQMVVCLVRAVPVEFLTSTCVLYAIIVRPVSCRMSGLALPLWQGRGGDHQEVVVRLRVCRLSGWQAGQGDLSGYRGAQVGCVLVTVGAAVAFGVEVSSFFSGSWSLEVPTAARAELGAAARSEEVAAVALGSICGMHDFTAFTMIPSPSDVATAERVATSEKASPRSDVTICRGLLSYHDKSLSRRAFSVRPGLIVVAPTVAMVSRRLKGAQQDLVCLGCFRGHSWHVGVSACAPGQGVPLGPSGGNATGCLPAFSDRRCSSLTSWSVQGAGWFCLWTLDLVERSGMLGACVVRLWSHVVAPLLPHVFDSAGSAGVVFGLTQSSCASALLELLLLWLGKSSRFKCDGLFHWCFGFRLATAKSVVFKVKGKLLWAPGGDFWWLAARAVRVPRRDGIRSVGMPAARCSSCSSDSFS
ncbi:hypothetical protein Taro_029897 [Colocasia esculenta]|uniref:Uncharacterized protein n=1 Tax=Colocasia esculenta TaxID=4460 RepID=A0A843VWA1_COLES|nr:hypothetical protein [Colocasia esculenta]